MMQSKVATLALMAVAAAQCAALGELEWLAGRWRGPVGRAESEEYWMRPKGAVMLGLNQTTAGGKSVAFEYLRIIQRGEDLFYVAQPGGKPPTEFKLTRSEPGLAVFENPEHDFPKIITYRLAPGGKGMLAIVEGVEKGKPAKLEFRFEKLD